MCWPFTVFLPGGIVLAGEIDNPDIMNICRVERNESGGFQNTPEHACNALLDQSLSTSRVVQEQPLAQVHWNKYREPLKLCRNILNCPMPCSQSFQRAGQAGVKLGRAGLGDRMQCRGLA